MATGDNLRMTTKGTLLKWTNYVHGWQPRYFILKNGILMYHKSEQETSFGCRGAIAVKASTFSLHEFDCCRFDVGVCDYVWYLRANTKEERDKWVLALEEQARAFDVEVDHNSQSQSQHQPVANHTVTNTTTTTTDNNSITTNNGKSNHVDLTQQPEQQQQQQQQQKQIIPLHPQSTQNQQPSPSLLPEQQPQQELQHLQYSDNFCDAQEHFEDPISDIADMPTSLMVEHQVNCSDSVKPIANNHIIDTVDHSKTTSSGDSLVENTHSKTTKEINGHSVSHETLAAPSAATIAVAEISSKQQTSNSSNSTSSSNSSSNNINNHNSITNNNNMTNNNTNGLAIADPLPQPNNPLWPKIDQITRDQLYYAQMGLGQEGTTDGWQLFAEDGQMRLYTRELEIDGLVCDPLKAVHVVKGITGFEMCHRFFSPNTRFEWEQTLESMKVLEEINKNTLIFHQVHKRIWPAAQRDAVFWSHIRQIEQPKPSCLSRDDINPTTRPDLKLYNVWIVCNNSTDKPEIALDSCVRIRLTVSLVCETYIPVISNIETVRREDLTCKIIYSSTINPGGWAPASILRTVYKREYPKFLENFSKYVISSTKSKPIVFE